MTPDNEMATAVTADAPMTETPSAAPVEALDSVADSPSPDAAIEDDLRAIFRKNNPDRDETGRFRGEPAQSADKAETEVSPDQPLAEGQEQVKPAIPAPQSWSAEAKAKWETLPPDIQETVAKREREAHEAITRQGQDLKAFEPIRNVIEHHRDIFERNGVSPDDGLGRLLNAERMLEQNPVAAIATIAQAYGVDLAQFAQGQMQGNAAPESQLHQRIAWLESQLNETSNRIAQREQAEANTQVQSITSMIEKFSADKSDWSDLEPDVLAEIVGIKAAIAEGIIPAMTPEQTLAKAYDRALRNNPVAWEKKQEAERKQQEAKRVEEARKRAADAGRSKAVNIVSTPAKGQVVRSMDDTLRDTYRKISSKG